MALECLIYGNINQYVQTNKMGVFMKKVNMMLLLSLSVTGQAVASNSVVVKFEQVVAEVVQKVQQIEQEGLQPTAMTMTQPIFDTQRNVRLKQVDSIKARSAGQIVIPPE